MQIKNTHTKKGKQMKCKKTTPSKNGNEEQVMDEGDKRRDEKTRLPFTDLKEPFSSDSVGIGGTCATLELVYTGEICM